MPTPTVPVSLTVHGTSSDFDLDVRTSLREYLHLTGSKKCCDHGQCGARTVLADGRRVNSCLAPAVAQQGREIVTVEGLSDDDSRLDPVQAAFLEWDAYECGYCTPGQIRSAVGMIDEVRRGWPSAVTVDLAAPEVTLDEDEDEDEVRERMSGNLCRCAAYANIVPAVLQAAEETL